MTTLRMSEHEIIAGREVVEVLDDSGRLIATVTPLEDEPGIRVISKHGLATQLVPASELFNTILPELSVVHVYVEKE